jgi:hypothetical protein
MIIRGVFICYIFNLSVAHSDHQWGGPDVKEEDLECHLADGGVHGVCHHPDFPQHGRNMHAELPCRQVVVMVKGEIVVFGGGGGGDGVSEMKT